VVLCAEPTTKAGALALLRFISNLIEEWGAGDIGDAPSAILNAVAFLEKETMARRN